VTGDSAPVAMITPLDWNPVTFRSQVAKFDDQFQHHGMTFQPLFTLPPDNLNLCTFLMSQENMTIVDAAHLTINQPIALLVAGKNS